MPPGRANGLYVILCSIRTRRGESDFEAFGFACGCPVGPVPSVCRLSVRCRLVVNLRHVGGLTMLLTANCAYYLLEITAHVPH